jgi:hypothetical protein
VREVPNPPQRYGAEFLDRSTSALQRTLAPSEPHHDSPSFAPDRPRTTPTTTLPSSGSLTLTTRRPKIQLSSPANQKLLGFTKRNNQTEKRKRKTQRLTCHPQCWPRDRSLFDTEPNRWKKKKKIAKVTCRTPNQPPKDLQKNIENGRGRWRHSRSNKEKKKWKLQVPTKENSGVPVTVNLWQHKHEIAKNLTTTMNTLKYFHHHFLFRLTPFLCNPPGVTQCCYRSADVGEQRYHWSTKSSPRFGRLWYLALLVLSPGGRRRQLRSEDPWYNLRDWGSRSGSRANPLASAHL